MLWYDQRGSAIWAVISSEDIMGFCVKIIEAQMAAG